LSWQIASLELLNGASNQWLRTTARPGPLMNCFPVEILSPVRPYTSPEIFFSLSNNVTD